MEQSIGGLIFLNIGRIRRKERKMMDIKGRVWGLVLVGLVHIGVVLSAPVPDIIFSQCECEAARVSHAFSFTTGGGFVSPLVALAAQDQAVSCPAGTAGTVAANFPATQGLLVNYANRETATSDSYSLQTTIDAGFLNGASTLNSFYFMFRMQMTAGASETQNLDFFNIADLVNLQFRPGNTAGTTPTRFTFKGFAADNTDLGSVEIIPGVNLNSGGAASYDGVVVFIGYHAAHAWFFCVKLVSTASQCSSLGGALKNNLAADPTLSLIFVSSIVARNFAGKFNYILLKNDASWNSAITDADESLAAAFLDANVPSVPESIPVPLATTTPFVTSEDTAVTVNINSALFLNIPPGATSYTFAYTPVLGSITAGTAASGSFDFTPSLNLNDADGYDFAQTYTVQLGSCVSPQGAFDITVNAVNDAPTINAPITTFNIFAGVEVNPSTTQILIANDVDDDTPLLDSGTATIQGASDISLIELYTSTDCSGSPITSGDLTITNGDLVYCILPLSGIVGNSATLVLQVKDDVGVAAASLVTLTFNGQNPLDIASSPPEFSGLEDAAAGITLDFTDLGILQGGTSTQFDVVLEELPLHGTLLINSVAGIVGTAYAATSTVKFNPTTDYLNRNGADNYVDALGNPIVNGCGDNVNGCPVTFTYHMREQGGSLESDGSQTVRIYVDAVDDGGAAANGPENFFVESGVATEISGITITSDKANDVFTITLHIFSDDGVQFTFSPGENAGIAPGTIVNYITISSGSCVSQFCDDAVVTGSPSILAVLANTIKAKAIQGEGSDPKINFEVFAAGQSGVADTHTMRFSFVAPKQGFFEKEENIYIVSGAGGGALLFVLGLMVYLRVQGRRMITKETLLTVAEQAVDIELRGEKGKHKKALNELDPKKSIKLNVDDEIFDWEKHIDKESGEVYFFNPKTGESQWDPPTVKNYSL